MVLTLFTSKTIKNVDTNINTNNHQQSSTAASPLIPISKSTKMYIVTISSATRVTSLKSQHYQCGVVSDS